MRINRFLSAALAAAVLTLSLVSCSSASFDSADSAKISGNTAASAPRDAEGYSYEYYFDGDYEVWEEAGMADWDAPASVSAQNDLSARKIIRTANVNFETTGYDAFLDSLNVCVAEFGGYLESSETYGGGIYSSRSNRSASLTVRIPAANYDGFMSKVSTLGALTYRSESKDDVTMSYVDTESHIRALETEYDTLIEILEKAESLEDVILLQSRISEVNYELDSYKSQLRKYDDLISYCTVYVNVNEVWRETLPDDHRQTFGERIATGLRENLLDIGEGASDFAVWFVVSLPYLLIWAVVVVAVVLIIRAVILRRRRKKEQKIVDAYLRSQKHEDKNTPDTNA